MLPLIQSTSFFHFGWYFSWTVWKEKRLESAKRTVWNCSTRVQTTKQLVDQTDCLSTQQFVLEVRRRLEQRVNENNRLERSDSNRAPMVNFILDMCCKLSYLYWHTRSSGGLERVRLVPIRLGPLSLVVTRTLASLPLRTGVGWAMAVVLWAASTTT